jgi:DNA-binding transcriptional ArsR family regulator
LFLRYLVIEYFALFSMTCYAHFMSTLPRSYVVKNPGQLAALACSARQEIVDVLSQMGSVSVAELAKALGRPADSLYYHLRVLTRSGLVRQDGVRSRAGREEALFRTVAPELRLRYPPRSPKNARAMTAIVSSMLRLGNRDFRRAIQKPDVIVAGKERELWALRRTAWLSREEIARVNRLIQSLADAVSGPKRPGRLYGITVLLSPLDRGRRQHTSSLRKEEK